MQIRIETAKLVGMGTPSEFLPLNSSCPRRTLQLGSEEDYPGVGTFRPENGDIIYIFSGRAFLEKLSYLKDAATRFLHRNVKWDLDFCRALMDKGMGVDELTWGADLNEATIARVLARREREIPSVFLFREQQAKPGAYLGISVQRKHFIRTDRAREVSILDHVLRVFEQGWRRDGRGRLTVGLALVRHGGAEFYIHKTGNPVAAYTNTQSPYLIQEGAHPFGSLVIKDPLIQEVREKSTKFILLPGRTILPTGVIKGDYPEPNRGFNVTKLRGGAFKIYQRMIDPEQLGMCIEGVIGEAGFEGRRYDSVAPIYRVR